MTFAGKGAIRSVFPEWTDLMTVFTSRSGRTKMTLPSAVIANVPALTSPFAVLSVITVLARPLASISDVTRFTFALSRLSVASSAVEANAGGLAVLSVVPFRAC